VSTPVTIPETSSPAAPSACSIDKQISKKTISQAIKGISLPDQELRQVIDNNAQLKASGMKGDHQEFSEEARNIILVFTYLKDGTVGHGFLSSSFTVGGNIEGDFSNFVSHG
jgi:hypothetical protein